MENRLLHIYHGGFLRRETRILDTDKSSPLYTIKSNSGSAFSSKPNVTFYDANNTIIGSASFRCFSRTIDLVIHGSSTSLERPSIWTPAHEYRSPTTGSTIQWRSDGIFGGRDMTCMDVDRPEAIARFEGSRFAVNKQGKVEIMPAVTGAMLDEVIISGTALIEDRRRRHRSAAGVAGGGGGGA